ncbi:transposable element Tc1 transposase [Trichonephila clavipes]|nr:transposable element Tc1 transposase [Trichonephila clavipes]
MDSENVTSAVTLPRRRILAHFEQMSEFERGRLLGFKEAVISGTLTAQYYVGDILRLVVSPFLLRHPRLTLQHDNDRLHTARVVLNCLQTCPNFLGQLGYLISPIEHIWDIMGRRLQAPRNVDGLAQELETVWHEIP